jgi:hypothetical protein
MRLVMMMTTIMALMMLIISDLMGSGMPASS